MSCKIRKNVITLTRGDTLIAKVDVKLSDGTEYIPKSGDVIRFAMKKTYSDSETLLNIQIPTDSMTLRIESAMTKDFEFGTYVYDVQLTKENGDVDTFITKGQLLLTEEVE
mgnify:CR=1 FL=1